MKKLDLYLQKARIKKTLPFIKHNGNILDIGSNDGSLFKYYNNNNISITGIGIDPDITDDIVLKNAKIYKDFYPSTKTENIEFDTIVMLAVFEHIPESEINKLVSSCYKNLKKAGYVVITVPSPIVDKILDILEFFKLIDGMALHEHHGFDVKKTPQFFEQAGFKLVKNKKFQLGLNNLFVFQK